MGREKKTTAWKNWICVSTNCSRVMEPSRNVRKYGLFPTGSTRALSAAIALRIQISEVARCSHAARRARRVRSRAYTVQVAPCAMPFEASHEMWV